MSGHVAWLNKPSEAWKQRTVRLTADTLTTRLVSALRALPPLTVRFLSPPQHKEERIDDCFAANITSEHPPPHVPPRLPSRPPTASPRGRVATPPKRPTTGATNRPATAPGSSPQHRAAPSYSQPTKSSSLAARAVVEMDGHLMRRGKRMEQLFHHADRERTGTLAPAPNTRALTLSHIPHP